MATKTELRRQELRDKLIVIAERTIAQKGLGALRARDLAGEAGCAVGAIYNVFGDLTDLALAVNARTFHRLGADVAEALADAPEDPVEQLVVMAQAYHRFAAESALARLSLATLCLFRIILRRQANDPIRTDRDSASRNP